MTTGLRTHTERARVVAAIHADVQRVGDRIRTELLPLWRRDERARLAPVQIASTLEVIEGSLANCLRMLELEESGLADVRREEWARWEGRR